MIAGVIPLKKMPRHLSIFDYLVPPEVEDKIAVGQQVKIPWRNQVIFGLVTELKKMPEKKSFQLKPLFTVTDEQPITTKQQAEVIAQASNYYHQSPSLFWKMILPSFPTKKTTYKTWLEETSIGTNEPDNSLKASVNNLSSGKSWRLIMPDTLVDMYQYTSLLAQSKGQTLIVCPELFHVRTVLSWLPRGDFSQIAVMHRDMSVSDYLDNYTKIISGKAKVILSTRIGLFLPFTDLKNVIVLKSEDYSLKQADQNPRFLVHTVLPWLQAATGCRVNYISMSPRLETYALALRKTSELINLQQPRSVTIVDVAQEFVANNFSFISYQLQKEILEVTAKGQKVFLLLNKKGLAKQVRCLDCKRLLTCPECQLALQPTENNRYICVSCKHIIAVTNCQHCQSVHLKPFGLTNRRIMSEISKIFPQVKSDWIDADKPKYSSNSLIVVGTEYAYQKLPLEKFGLFAVVLVEELVNPDEYRSNELRYQLLNNFIRLSAAPKVFIQTFNLEDPLLADIIRAEYKTFWNREMHWRKKLGYPPYKRILKISYSHTQLTVAERTIKRVYRDVANSLPSDVVFYEPQRSVRKINNKYNYSFILKFDKNEQIEPIFSVVPASCILDFNPYYMF